MIVYGHHICHISTTVLPRKLYQTIERKGIDMCRKLERNYTLLHARQDNGKDNHQRAEGSSGCQTQEVAGWVQTRQWNMGTSLSSP